MFVTNFATCLIVTCLCLDMTIFVISLQATLDQNVSNIGEFTKGTFLDENANKHTKDVKWRAILDCYLVFVKFCVLGTPKWTLPILKNGAFAYI